MLALDEGPLLGIPYLLFYLGVVVASARLQSRLFLVFGALGCDGYVSYLAFDVFEGTLSFVFALALVGPWLERAMRRPEPARLG